MCLVLRAADAPIGLATEGEMQEVDVVAFKIYSEAERAPVMARIGNVNTSM